MSRIGDILRLPDLRIKIGFTLLVLAVYRLGSHIPIAGIDTQQLSALFQGSGVLGFINLFSGGGLSRFSILALGILPYINASIIMQLLTFVSDQMKELAKEGESGRKQISQYTRYLTVILAAVQAVFMAFSFRGFLTPDTSVVFFMFVSIVGLTAGAVLTMWLGELITERGIGNGASLIIFVGIVAQMPFYIRQTYVLVQGGISVINVAILVMILVAMIFGIVVIQEAQRKIHVQYAKRVVGRRMMGGQSTFIPLKLVQGGVLPIIFASAILNFPAMFIPYIHNGAIQSFYNHYFSYSGVMYNVLFCILIFFFTYFYTAITFNPTELADNLKKYGGFIVGVRPGQPTVDFLDSIISKLTLVGASVLALIAIVPVVATNLTRVSSFAGLGGTALLIMVGVALDLVKQVEAYLISKRYEGLLE